MIGYLHCSGSDIIHLLHPQHLILRFEVFVNAIPPGYLLRRRDLLRCLFVDVGKAGIQPAAGRQLCVQGFARLFDVLQVPLPPNTDRPFVYASAGR